MQEAVHFAQCPGIAITFLTVKRKIATWLSVFIFYFFGYFYQQRCRTAGRIANTISGLGIYQLGEKGRYFFWREKLTTFLARSRSKPFQEIHVGITQYIGHIIIQAGSKIELWLGKIIKKTFQSAVAVFGLTELIRVECNVSENTFQLF